jgi:hypothetical protein
MPARKFNGEPVNAQQPVLDEHKRELMLAIFIRNQTAFLEARPELKPEHFGPFDLAHQLVWSVVCDFYDRYEALPDDTLLATEIETVLTAHPDMLPTASYDRLNSFRELAFSPDTFPGKSIETSPVLHRWALDALKCLRNEGMASRLKGAAGTDSTVPVNFPKLISDFAAESDKIAAIGAGVGTTAFPKDWHRSSPFKTWSTGLDFVNKYMGGGQVDGEVYGLLGPFGSCKTLCACTLAIEAARFFAAEAAQNPDRKRKVAFLLSYEADVAEIQRRTLGYAAKIQRSEMEAIPADCPLEEANLSRTGKLKEYERFVFKKALAEGKTVSGELERLIHAQNTLNPYFIPLDMKGRRGIGSGGIKEAARLIAAECRHHDVECGWVGIDYVKAMIARFMQAGEMSNDELRFQIQGVPLMAKDNIAHPFHCPVWLLHQLSGDANSFKPGVLADHTHSSESKSFAENLDFSFSIGKPEESLQAALFGCSKHRRQPGFPNSIIKIDGALNRVYDGSRLFQLNEVSRTIMTRNDFKAIPETARKTVVRVNPSNVT